MSISNENFSTGGTGGAIFGGPQGAVPVRTKPGHEALGDDYRAPAALAGVGMGPDYDEDDRVNPNALKVGEPSGKAREIIFGKCFPDPRQQGLAVAKLFYFFFFSAFGSLFPLMGVYFKQLGMDAAQAGFLSGIRPIIEYLATPFWNGISARYTIYPWKRIQIKVLLYTLKAGVVLILYSDFQVSERKGTFVDCCCLLDHIYITSRLHTPSSRML